ncbi:MAG: anthranilate phosphoribosyltransferase [Kiritimatiellaceae bacterium]|nr:anthranilate phosphoribosyltransferase [Kiritimatiellaceae bacterium]
MIKDAIQALIEGKTIARDEAYRAIMTIMKGEATPAQIGGFIAAVRMHGETPEIIAGAAQAMRENMVKIRCDDPNAVDIVGTGGDGAHTFNISTAAAFVTAGAGVTVAKHGSYGVSSKCGSANVLSELGINLQYSPQKMEECLETIGIAFLFAQALHPAMKYAAAPRKELGFWSLFNILGPLCNPAGVKNGVLGVFSSKLVPVIADACAQLGASHLFVVHGNDGLDEITTTTTSLVTEIRRSKLETYEVQPAGLGLPPACTADITGGEPAENAKIVRAILAGKEKGAKRDIVLLNAAFAIMAGGKAKTPPEGIQLAAESIDSGAALEKLELLAEASQQK